MSYICLLLNQAFIRLQSFLFCVTISLLYGILHIVKGCDNRGECKDQTSLQRTLCCITVVCTIAVIATLVQVVHDSKCLLKPDNFVLSMLFCFVSSVISIDSQLVKKFLAFCGTERFVTMFTRAS
jgi:hypothetical protein